MQLKIFAVRDAALGEFMQPFVAPSTGIALRSFSNEVNDVNSPFHKHPKDFELFQLGEYDPSNGIITQGSAPVTISRAADCLVKEAA